MISLLVLHVSVVKEDLICPKLTYQEIVEWHDSDDDDYFSDDESLFSEDKDLLHDDNNDVESSAKDKLWSLFQLLQVPND